MHLELKGRLEEYEREKHKYNNDVLELQKEVIVHHMHERNSLCGKYILLLSILGCLDTHALNNYVFYSM